MRLGRSRAGRRALLAAVSIGWTAIAISGCRDRKPKPLIQHAAVVRCERGASHAGSQDTMQKATALYYQACADIHAEKGCSDAFKKASKAKIDDQLGIVVDGCKAAYCPILGAERFEICKPSFKPTQAGMTRAWPPFHDAILERDAKALAPRINNALLGFYIKSQALAKAEKEREEKATPPADAGKPKPAGDAGAAPPSGSGVPPAGSVAPPASGAPAPSAAPAASK